MAQALGPNLDGLVDDLVRTWPEQGVSEGGTVSARREATIDPLGGPSRLPQRGGCAKRGANIWGPRRGVARRPLGQERRCAPTRGRAGVIQLRRLPNEHRSIE